MADQEFSFSRPLVDKILAFLDDTSSALDRSRIASVGEAFGGSPAGQACARDADRAKEHVCTTFVDMVAGLRAYRVGLDDMYRQATGIDEDYEAQLTLNLARAEACQSDSFAAVSQCTVSGSSNEARR